MREHRPGATRDEPWTDNGFTRRDAAAGGVDLDAPTVAAKAGSTSGVQGGVARRDVLRWSAAALGGAVAGVSPFGLRDAQADWSGGGVRSHGESLIGTPKYGPDFPHFDYVNPDAPKGGRARLSVTGLFDTFNPFNAKGSAAPGVRSLVYETLMTPSLDEGSTHYGLLAEWTEIAQDRTWVAFRLRDGALWHDGRPIAVADVEASFELLISQGHPQYRFYYADVDRLVDEGDRVVRFWLKNPENRELPHILGQLDVMPAHWWADHAFDQTILTPLLGSGPYRIERFEEGRYVSYRRVEDYWGRDLPVRIGTYNFDEIRFEHLLDRDTAFEAFKKGDVDFWSENSAQRWAERFEFPARSRGHVVRREVSLDGPKFIQGYVFNTRRAKFADRRVREALTHAFDFEWTNKALFFGQYARPSSYFQGSDALMALGAPDDAERALLTPFQDQLPLGLLEQAFEQPVTDASGRNRRGLRTALALLSEAGWTVQDGALTNADGEVFAIEFLVPQGGASARVVQPMLGNFERLGISASLREVDGAQFIRRRRAYDFDMIVGAVSNSESPGNEQREFWGARAADAPGGRNLAGVKNPVVDALIETIVAAPTRDALETASRALDRVLLWERYLILQLYEPDQRIAHWDRFGAPDPLPPRSVGFPQVWWWDDEKASRL